jgi:hypothetical protein
VIRLALRALCAHALRLVERLPSVKTAARRRALDAQLRELRLELDRERVGEHFDGLMRAAGLPPWNARG